MAAHIHIETYPPNVLIHVSFASQVTSLLRILPVPGNAVARTRCESSGAVRAMSIDDDTTRLQRILSRSTLQDILGPPLEYGSPSLCRISCIDADRRKDGRHGA